MTSGSRPADVSRMARSRSASRAPIRRARSWRLVASLALVATIASPVLAIPRSNDEPAIPPTFTPLAPVPSPEPSRPPPGIGVEGARPSDPGRPVVRVPESPVIVVARPDQPSHTDRSAGTVRGTASWYCGHGSACTRGYAGGPFAAAGPSLRVGDWRGRSVLVRAGSHEVRVTLIDWCACPHRTLDLYSDAFSRLAPLSRGLVKVTVTW